MTFLRCFILVSGIFLTCSIWADDATEYAYLKRQLADDSRDLAIHLDYQRLGIKLGDRAQVLNTYRTLLKQHPNDGLYLYLYGRLLKNAEQQRAYFVRAVRADSTLFRAQVDLGKSYYASGRYDAALARYHAALRLRPQSAAVENLLGLAYYFQGYPDQAIVEYRRAIALDPYNAEVYLNLGLAYYYTDQTDAAIQTYERAIAKAHWEGDQAFAYHDLGIAYRKKGLLDKARKAYLKALSINPHYVSVYISLGNLAFENGDYPAAVEAYQKVLGTDAESTDLVFHLGLAQFNQKAYKAAIGRFQAVLARDSTRVEVYDYLGRAYYADGQLDPAEKYLEAYIAKENRSGESDRRVEASRLLSDIRRERITNMFK